MNTQGTKGQVRVASDGDFETFSVGQTVWVEKPEGQKRALTVESSRGRKQMIVLSFREVKAMNEAGELVGSSVYVDAADLEPLPPDEFYWYQLRGMEVRTEEGLVLGEIEDLLPTGSNDVYVVRKNGREILIPATDEVIVSVDLAKKVMTVHLLEGLSPEDEI
ncbi:MAG TPA: ribosome maturation factor RimM [Thermodesulfobacteriota bacterium]|nr:ribosome maturation factor RimM [Thermodesulfobacteriota bacterium]